MLAFLLMGIVVKQRRRWAIAFGVATLATGCGDGLFTRSVVPPGPDAGAQDTVSIQDTVSTAPDMATLDAPLPDFGQLSDEGPLDTGDMGPPATASTPLPVKAGAAAMGQLGAARVIVPAMSFDQDVVLTLQSVALVVDAAVGPVYRLELDPMLAHSRNALHFELVLTTDQQAISAELRLATLKSDTAVPFWYAVSGQAYRATDHTLGADFYGLDRGPVYFTLLRFCADKAACTQPAVCSSMLCQ